MPLAGDFRPQRSTGETRVFSIDFGPELDFGETITSASASLVAWEGTDSNASSLLILTPQINGTVVSQRVGGTSPGFVPGVTYRLTLTANTNFSGVIVEYGHITCLAIN